MVSSSQSIRFADVQRRFDRASEEFDRADFVHRHAFDGLLERLAPATIDPGIVVDLGAATGAGTERLARTYGRGRVIAFDASAEMLRRATRRGRWLARRPGVQGDALRLPFRNESIDLAFANFLMPWVTDYAGLFAGLARVLRRGGVFAFSTLGPDSLREIRDAWLAVDGEAHVARFPDMHDIGDALLKAGLADPVLDVDYLSITYRDCDALMRDLVLSGSGNTLSGRRRSLTGRGRMDAMRRQLAQSMRDGVLTLRLELVFGHAWGAGPRRPDGEFRIDPAKISRRSAIDRPSFRGRGKDA